VHGKGGDNLYIYVSVCVLCTCMRTRMCTDKILRPAAGGEGMTVERDAMWMRKRGASVFHWNSTHSYTPNDGTEVKGFRRWPRGFVCVEGKGNGRSAEGQYGGG